MYPLLTEEIVRQERSEKLRREILALRRSIKNLETELQIKAGQLQEMHGRRY